MTFAELTGEVLDATTAIEDKDFWDNPGFDLAGFLSATVDTVNGRPRGGSTITQQLVRARLLPPSAFAGSREERKIREIIQALRLTQEFPGKTGKQQIITAYMNQNFYGNQSYGSEGRGQDVLRQGPQGPHPGRGGDPRRDPPVADGLRPDDPRRAGLRRARSPRASTVPKFQLVVPADSAVVVRRNYILDRMKTESPLSGSRHTVDEYERAKSEPVILAPQLGVQWRAPHFVWQVREELGRILCPEVAVDACDKIDTGGYTVTTTLNWTMQATTEKWVYVASRATNFKDTAMYLKNLKIPSSGLQLAAQASRARTSTTAPRR